MPGTQILLAALVGAFPLLGVPQPSHAQILAVWASRSGANSNDCTTPTTPCRSIGASGALSKVEPGGTIHVLPGTYGSVFITKSVQIVVDEGEPEVSGTVTDPVVGAEAAFVIDAGANDVVRIRGMIVNPTGLGSSIALIAGGALHVENCTLVGSGDHPALRFAPSAASELYVSGSIISESGPGPDGSGILIKPTGSGSAKVVLDNVSVSDNSAGINIDGRTTTGTNSVTVRNSTIAGSTEFGVNAIDSGGGATNLMIEGSNVSNNGSFGVVANGANATVRMRNSTVTGHARGIIFTASGGKLISNGGNVVTGNTVDGAFSSTVAQK